MASINYAAREITVKIVYWGITDADAYKSLEVIYKKVPPELKSDMVRLLTESSPTLFFDYIPTEFKKIKGFATKFQVYTCPTQIYLNATRKLILRGIDGVVFVVDSGSDKIDENVESLEVLKGNLEEYGYKIENIPIIIQYNKRDLPNALTIEELQKRINKYNLPWCESVTNKDVGIFDSIKLIGKLVVDYLNKKYSWKQGNKKPTFAFSPLEQQSIGTMLFTTITNNLNDISKKVGSPQAGIRAGLLQQKIGIHNAYVLDENSEWSEIIQLLQKNGHYSKKLELIEIHESRVIEPTEVRIFISSTFVEFNAERELIIEYVFPKLRKYFKNVAINIKDLENMGEKMPLNDQHAAEILMQCLDHIDESRPFFICFLGERYGTVPDSRFISQEFIKKYDLFKIYNGWSFTQIEVNHALHCNLRSKSMNNVCKHAFFYFRNSKTLPPLVKLSHLNEIEKEKFEKTYIETSERRRSNVNKFKNEIIKHFATDAKKYVHLYDAEFDELLIDSWDKDLKGMFTQASLKPLGDRIFNDLKTSIENEYADHINMVSHQASQNSNQYSDSDYQWDFVSSRLKNRIVREQLLNVLVNYFNSSDTRIFGLFGDGGSGKSTLLCQIGNYYKNKDKKEKCNVTVISYFIGVSKDSSDINSVLLKICTTIVETVLQGNRDLELQKVHVQITEVNKKIEQIKANSSLTDDLKKENKKELEIELLYLNGQLYQIKQKYSIPIDSVLLYRKFKELVSWIDTKTIIIIDAIDQLVENDTSSVLKWLPVHQNSNVKIVVSAIDGPARIALEQTKCISYTLTPLSGDEREAVFNDIVARNKINYSEKFKDIVFSCPDSGNPLYLQLLLNEIRLCSNQPDKFAAFLKCIPKTLTDIYMHTFTRLEIQYGEVIVNLVFSAIACSRFGLTEQEISEIVKENEKFGRPHLILNDAKILISRHSDLIRFYHPSFGRAVKNKYMGTEDRLQSMHGLLAKYFSIKKNYHAIEIKNSNGEINLVNTPNMRRLIELPWNAMNAGDQKLINELFEDIEMFQAIIVAGMLNDFMQFHQKFAENKTITTTDQNTFSRMFVKFCKEFEGSILLFKDVPLVIIQLILNYLNEMHPLRTAAESVAQKKDYCIFKHNQPTANDFSHQVYRNATGTIKITITAEKIRYKSSKLEFEVEYGLMNLLSKISSVEISDEITQPVICIEDKTRLTLDIINFKLVKQSNEFQYFKELKFTRQEPYTTVSSVETSEEFSQKIEIKRSKIVDVSPDGKFLLWFAGYPKRSYYLLDIQTRKSRCLGFALDSRFTPDGNIAVMNAQSISISTSLGIKLITISRYNKAQNKVYATYEFFKMKNYTSKSNAVEGDLENGSITFTPDGLHIIEMNKDSFVYNIPMHSHIGNGCLLTQHTRPQKVYCAPDGKMGLIVDNYNCIMAFDFKTNVMRGFIPMPFNIKLLQGIRPDGSFYCVGESDEWVFVTSQRFLNAPIRATAVRRYVISESPDAMYESFYNFNCPNCNRRSRIPDEKISDIKNVMQDKRYVLSPAAYPPLSIEAWEDPNLNGKCCECNQPVVYNPFLIDSSDKDSIYTKDAGQRQKEPDGRIDNFHKLLMARGN